jgi:hypothetical protein
VTDQTKETVLGILEKYGFSTLVACALMYVARQDIILPMVDAHRSFLKELSETQHDISKAITDQTRLLYAMQPRDGFKPGGVQKTVEVQD